MPHLTPRAKEVLDYLQAKGTASPREALLDIDINSGSFTRRIAELRTAGYKIESAFQAHPVSGRQYKRYTLVLD
ncbi:hypothetical protein BSL82_03900 [Tardibacter chloracetimidivorans]|uniref:Winged helix-turn-helix domain-containing protein n=1 Tax=Tardibacter chloracetimidivorans TaxID=1921510 RepID=A0A1L3ZSF7_9SPHN|nr:helix-turn-helix domain-containing protein [Tardibacter chloracetimidivorans]API58561.1 hypothetical protein BSL82_03900 [Tardibacter chloracetimidivorans]